MFGEIFRFEVQNKLRRPAVWLYLAATILFMLLTFAKGAMPLGEKQHINSPQMIGFWCAGMTMLMMIVSSSVMGMALYRDIEFSTKDYYLTYPITKSGYFWGRFTGSFLFMLLIGVGILLGAFLGIKLGPVFGWSDVSRYGPNKLWYFIQPYCIIVIPNLIFTSCVFYGLVAVTRNVKVVYLGGILLFLAYFISMFFFNHSSNVRVMVLSDPFLLTGARMQMIDSPSAVQNSAVIVLDGDFLLNRLIWGGLGIVVVLVTYWRFNFERFFAGRRDKAAIDEPGSRVKRPAAPHAVVEFTGPYERRTFLALTGLELRNIVRDSYFWIILGAGSLVLGISFWDLGGPYGVENTPRTVELMEIFEGTFLFFVFFILLFYTGETLHRDRITRYAFINDSLPPPNRVINGSRLIALLAVAAGLALLPLLVGVFVQICKGFYVFNLREYFSSIVFEVLPRLIEIVFFCYTIHVVLNNKFAAHAVAAVLWIGIFILVQTGTFDYFLWLYPYGPDSAHTDINGIANLLGPLLWFHSYWLSFGGLLIIVAALFFNRGVSTSFKERLQMIPERFTPGTRVATGIFLGAFLTLGGWIYYNITFLNDYNTSAELNANATRYERTLKHYDSLPLPVVTRMRLEAELYPEQQLQFVHGFITIANLTNRPVRELLLDGDHITDYQLAIDGRPIPYTAPLTWERGFVNFLRPAQDSAPFRLYRLSKPLLPGDSAVVEIHSSLVYPGFQDRTFGDRQLRNGFFFDGGLPELGYDDDDEISSPYERRQYHLPPKVDKDDNVPRNDPVGMGILKAGAAAHLMAIDLTIGTTGDQTVVGQGELVGQWSKDGRNYFHYVLDHPGSYPPFAAFSARYAVLADSVEAAGHPVSIRIYYHPAHSANVRRFLAGYKDALGYYSRAYGPYPFGSIRLAEGVPSWSRMGSTPTLGMIAEDYGWNAYFRNPDEFDYCYFLAARLTAQQWWRFQVAPNETLGSRDIPEGLATYDALVMTEHKYGKDNMQGILRDQLWAYTFIRRRQEDADSPLIASNHWFSWDGRAAVELYALRDLIGEDSIDAALREFRDSYSFRTAGPYAGSGDLFAALGRHTPDSIRYFLTDGWLKNRLYDNRVNSVTVTGTGRPDEYKVELNVHVEKVYVDAEKRETVATGMADYIDIGVFGAPAKDAVTGRDRVNPLYLQRYKLTAGDHSFTMVVHGKPTWAGIDPYSKLIDQKVGDNTKSF